MAIRINFDSEHNIIDPTLVLTTKNGTKLGILTYYNWSFREELNSCEMAFSVSKYDNGEVSDLWDSIVDFKLVWCREWDVYFEINVEVNENDETIKNVSAKSLGIAELSQIMLYNIEINTEDDIARDDYDKPTVLYDAEHPASSLLHRISEKIPHYTISHVDSSIADIQRTFSFDNVSIWDAFREIGEEIGCIFTVEANEDTDSSPGIKREIKVYDLEYHCNACGTRSEFSSSCPKCGSTDISSPSHGSDTNIFISIENLADEITYTTNQSSIKNCFKLKAGDDLMTASIINCNPNGSQYIWSFSDETIADMNNSISSGGSNLVTKLENYDTLFDEYQTSHSYSISEFSSYNLLIQKYNEFLQNRYDLTENQVNEKKIISDSVIGFPNLMSKMYDVIDMILFLEHELLPIHESPVLSATGEMAKLSNLALATSVLNTSSITLDSATNAVINTAKTIVSPLYEITAIETSLSGTTWRGKIKLSRYSDPDNDSYTSPSTFEVSISDNYENYVQQKIDRIVNRQSNEVYGITELFKQSDLNFEGNLKKYSLKYLELLESAATACIDILIEQNISDNKHTSGRSSSFTNLYNSLYTPYYKKYNAILAEKKIRQSEIKTCNDLSDKIETLVTETQTALNFKNYLGTDLWKEFSAYRRDDVYENNNYISDGLTNAELFKRSLEFIDKAKKEIYKSSRLQHSITASLANLLTMEEFEPIVNDFGICNWLTLKVNDEIFRLRLVSYEITSSDLSHVDVEFSDITRPSDQITNLSDLLSKVNSMTSSYDAVIHQAERGSKGYGKLGDWVGKGLDLTNMKIVRDNDNQLITWDEHGMLAREYLPVTDDYSDKQLKIINRGLYVTDNGWESTRAAIGDFIYFDPDSRTYKESYGVIADTLVGNLILSSEVGVYNDGGSIKLDENGITLTIDTTNSTTLSATKDVFKIKKKYTQYDQYGESIGDQEENIIYFDDEGNACFKGKITATSLFIGDNENTTIGDTINSAIGSYDFSSLETSIQANVANTIKDDIDGKSTIFYSDNAPQDASNNDLWVKSITIQNSVTGANEKSYELYRYVVSGSSGSWQPISDTATTNAIAGLGTVKAIADGKIKSYAQNSAPSPTDSNPPSEGDLWIDTDDNNKMYRYKSTLISSRPDDWEQKWNTYYVLTNNQYTLNDSDTWDSSKSYYKLWHSVADMHLDYLIDRVDGKVSAYYSTSEPTDLNDGDLWFDAEHNRIKRYNDNAEWKINISNYLRDFIDVVYGQLSERDNWNGDNAIRFFYQSNTPPYGTEHEGNNKVSNNDIWYKDNLNDTKNLRYYNSANIGNQWNSSYSGFNPQPSSESVSYVYTNILNSTQTDNNSPKWIYFTSSNPSGNIQEGDIWYDTSTYEIKVYTKWDDITEGLFSDANDTLREVAEFAGNVKDIADSKVDIYTMTMDEMTSNMTPDSPIVFERGDLWVNTSNNNELNYYDGNNWNIIRNDMTEYDTRLSNIESKYTTISDDMQSKYQSAINYANSILNDYKTDVGQYFYHDPSIGIVLGAKTSSFKTVIDNTSLRFTDSGTTVAYISNRQLNIEEAIIKGTFILGKFVFTPHSSDNGFSITYKS